MYALLAALPAWFSPQGSDDHRRNPRRSLLRASPQPVRDSAGEHGDEHVGDDSHDALITRLRAGDASALADAHAEYAVQLWQHAHRYVKDRDVAEDIVQDVFVAVWERRTRLPLDATLRAYLYASVRYRALNQRRHWNVVERTQEDAAANAYSGVTPAIVPADAQAEEETLETLVRNALDQLPERQRAAIELHCLQQLSQTETAKVLHISEASVRKLLDRAIVRLESLHRRLRA